MFKQIVILAAIATPVMFMSEAMAYNHKVTFINDTQQTITINPSDSKDANAGSGKQVLKQGQSYTFNSYTIGISSDIQDWFRVWWDIYDQQNQKTGSVSIIGSNEEGDQLLPWQKSYYKYAASVDLNEFGNTKIRDENGNIIASEKWSNGFHWPSNFDNYESFTIDIKN